VALAGQSMGVDPTDVTYFREMNRALNWLVEGQSGPGSPPPRVWFGPSRGEVREN
jgi:hypothetical protein